MAQHDGEKPSTTGSCTWIQTIPTNGFQFGSVFPAPLKHLLTLKFKDRPDMHFVPSDPDEMEVLDSPLGSVRWSPIDQCWQYQQHPGQEALTPEQLRNPVGNGAPFYPVPFIPVVDTTVEGR